MWYYGVATPPVGVVCYVSNIWAVHVEIRKQAKKMSISSETDVTQATSGETVPQLCEAEVQDKENRSRTTRLMQMQETERT